MNATQDTIAAISTAPGEGSISVVRISGPDSLTIADRLFSGARARPSSQAGGTFLHGYIKSAGKAGSAPPVDEVLLLIFRAPHSYTREDVVEIQGHGGRQSAQRILRAVLEAGARPAEPGEFTRRAFLNGRIDLLQAEAVADLIRAQTDRAAAAAMEQLDGNLTSSFRKCYDQLLGAASEIEAALDFPEDELPEADRPALIRSVEKARQDLLDLLSTWDEGHLIRDGALAVIAGRPNAGKSTLLNTLLGKSRAIVAETPGTTRDTIEEQIVIAGMPVRLVDTAGLTDTDSPVERDGVLRARALLEKADLVLYVVDGSARSDPEDLINVQNLSLENTLIILNKNDLCSFKETDVFKGFQAIPVSLLSASGVENIREWLHGVLSRRITGVPHATISERHRHVIQNVLAVLNESISLLRKDEDLSVPAVSLMRSALHSLGTVIGLEYTDDLLNSIFSRFCIGK